MAESHIVKNLADKRKEIEASPDGLSMVQVRPSFALGQARWNKIPAQELFGSDKNDLGKSMEGSVAFEYRERSEDCARCAEIAEDEIAKADLVRLSKAWLVLAENAEKQTVYKIVRDSTFHRVSR